MEMRGLIEGCLVHYVLPEGPSKEEHRPAIILRVWNKVTGVVNLTVFYDWSNDAVEPGIPGNLTGTAWRTSVIYDPDKKLGTWHWIEREEEPGQAAHSGRWLI